MGSVPNTELNITFFYRNHNFYCLFGKISLVWIWNNIEVLTKPIPSELMWEIIIWDLSTQCMATCIYGQKHKNMTSSKRVHTRHHIRRFILKSLSLKILLNIGQTPGTMAERKREKYGQVWRGPLLTAILIFFWFWRKPIMEDEHNIFLPKSDKEEITVTD